MLTPLKNKVLVQKDEPKKETEEGILIPEIAQEKDAVIHGTVLAVGPNLKEPVKAGDRILFGKHDGFAIDVNYCDGHERCVIIADNQVRCILNA